MFCPHCGKPNPDDAQYCSVCGRELNAPAQQAAQEEQNKSLNVAPVQYAGFWRRVLAVIIDGLIISIVSVPLTWKFKFDGFTLSYGFGMIIQWLYFSLFESSFRQATIGKMAIGIVVTDESYRRISFARASGRYFGKYLSAIILGIGFLMAAFTEKKQALHDILADTLVVQK
ncbi:MAG: RDD family protein [Calditrichaeota bacterium]|nr:RDD family protein [Calditrichota bacterium]MCB9369543.1 RDD family protein [Calditrichota bacterium]